MLPDCLSAEGERRCRRLLEGATARLRARPAAAAVLVPLCSVRGVPALLYTLRSSRLAGRHKGDVSFPGGKCDPADQDVVHTALRETREELGLAVPEERVWGILQPVHDRGKAPVVPVLASVGPLDPQNLRPNREEPHQVRPALSLPGETGFWRTDTLPDVTLRRGLNPAHSESRALSRHAG
uniref:Nudix hydrolase domain-containing protein n=1 Tax=Equus asinus TaxID=9793 RepID=A0A8C4LDS9_EQUAS